MTWHAVAAQTPLVAHAGGLHAVAPVHSDAEREATRVAEDVVPAGSGPPWAFGEVPIHQQDWSVRGSPQEMLGATLGTDLADVRLRSDGEAADLTRRAGAAAVTVGREVSFAPGRDDLRTHDGARRLVHEVTHAARHAQTGLAHRDGKSAVASATTLDGLPEADRKAIQVVTTTAVTVTGLTEKFGTVGGKMTLGLPANTAVVPDASAAKVDPHGLANVAAALVTEADVAPAPLPENATATLELDLSPYGGIKGLYRFTYHAPRPAPGAKTSAKRVLVEQLGAATTPAGQQVPQGTPGAPAKDPVADKMTAAGITHSYSGDKLEALRAAISEVPAAHLAKVSGLKFRSATAHPTKPSAAGDYNQLKHTVTMYANAFATVQNKFAQGTVATSYATRAIIHEIGHAVDLAPLRTAYGAYQGAGTAKAKTALLAARSHSGTRTVLKDGDFEDEIGTKTTGVAFREAVKKDGGRDVSKYAEEDWQESYAEAYSLFISSPDQLKALRPATHAHLLKALPR